MKKAITIRALLALLIISSANAVFALKPFNAGGGPTGVESETIDGEYIGGIKVGTTTLEPFFSNPVNSGDIIVKNKAELLKALKDVKRGQTIFIDGDARIDLTGENKITIPHGITLASNRGYNGSKGGLIFTDLHGVSPLFRANGNGVTITGLRLSGPDTAVYYNITDQTKSISPIDLQALKNNKDDYQVKKDALPRSTGIAVEGSNVEIYNCELYGWTNAAIQVSPSASNTIVRHNYIHHNQHFGLGYGVLLYKSTALIKANLFDYNNHSVTGSGHSGTGFEVVNNIFKENHIRAWAIDMHGGVDRNDGTDLAGDSFIVQNNDFYLHFGRPGINIRGVPARESRISNNKFVYLADDDNITSYQRRREELGVGVRIDRSGTALNSKSAMRFKGNRVVSSNNEVQTRK